MRLENELFTIQDGEKWIRLRDAKAYEQSLLKEVFNEIESHFNNDDPELVCNGCEYYPCFNEAHKCFTDKCIWWQSLKCRILERIRSTK